MKHSIRSLCRWTSLRTRLTLGVLLAVIVALWLATYLTSHFLRQDMEQVIADLQYSTIELLTQDVDRSLQERKQALEGVAAKVDSALMADPQRLQILLEARVVVPLMFNWGVVVVNERGVAIASVPSRYGRVGTDYSSLPQFQQALRSGQPMFFEPMLGKRTGQPVLSIAVPVKDERGRVLGLLIGVTNLAQSNFLDQINSRKYGKTGDYQLVSPRSRLIITSSDKTRIMQSGPHQGDDPVFERFLAGYEGAAVQHRAHGRDALWSSKRVPATGWLLQSELPAAEAFAPIHDMQGRLLIIWLLLTIPAGGLAWWWLRHQLRPLEETARLLVRMRDDPDLRQPLPVRYHDEVGQLARAFNNLLATIVAEEARAAEHAANQRLQKIVSQVPGVLFQYCQHRDGSAGLVYVSEACRDVFGLSPAELCDNPANLLMQAEADDSARVVAAQQRSARYMVPWRVEFRIRQRDGLQKWLLIDAQPEMLGDGEMQWFGFVADITESKSIDAELRIAATTFESQEGIFITDAKSRIIRVNKAFSEVTGYSASEAVGKTPALLKSGRHDPGFYQRLWATLLEEGYWRGEIWNRRKNGEVFAEWVTITSVRDSDGQITHYVAAFTDITEHKQIEEEVRRLAFYDPLTNLPNRRLFYDRLDQALAAAVRSGNSGALLFIDLDQFKLLNDTHGHFMGDELLLEVARRLALCVRASDTVARLGGDEFVVLLQDLDTHASGNGEARGQAAQVAEKIRQTLAEPYLLLPSCDRVDQSPVNYQSTTSIGVTLFCGENERRDEIIRQADVAMYLAKEAGRNQVRFFEKTQTAEFAELS